MPELEPVHIYFTLTSYLSPLDTRNLHHQSFALKPGSFLPPAFALRNDPCGSSSPFTTPTWRHLSLKAFLVLLLCTLLDPYSCIHRASQNREQFLHHYDFWTHLYPLARPRLHSVLPYGANVWMTDSLATLQRQFLNHKYSQIPSVHF